MILDSGNRREFPSGSVRDISEGKGRCDLLPLGIIGARMESKTLEHIEMYIRCGSVNDLWAALDYCVGGEEEDFITAMLDVSVQYEEGAKKYSDRNWEKGIPLHCYIDSAVRHYLKFSRGDVDENHSRAFIWNIICAIWTHENKPEMIDLPFKDNWKKANPLIDEFNFIQEPNE